MVGCAALRVAALVVVLGMIIQPMVSAAGMDPARAVEQAVKTSGVFPAGTAALSFRINGSAALIDLSPEAVRSGLGDAQADAMARAIANALSPWPQVSEIEVTVAGRPLWEYLSKSPQRVPPGRGRVGESEPLRIALHPGHGSYWNELTGEWARAQGILSGPNPETGIPTGWTGSTWMPSDHYFWTRGLNWSSVYEDDVALDITRFLARYLEAAGAVVYVSRELDPLAGDYDCASNGYPNAGFDLPKDRVASKYHLQSRGGVPQWVWDDPATTSQIDKDLRSRASFANANNCHFSLSIHSGSSPSGARTGTHTYYYSKYNSLKYPSYYLARAVQTGVVLAVRGYFDDSYGVAAYTNSYGPGSVPEWPFYAPYPTPEEYPGYTQWNDDGTNWVLQSETLEALMPSAVCEVAYHDDWKFFPDSIFLQDRIWQSAVAWGMYEGVSRNIGITPWPACSAAVVSVECPSLVGPNTPVSATVTVRNLGMTWCWGDRWESGLRVPYTVWALGALGDAPGFSAPAMLSISDTDTIGPGDTKTFTIPMTSPSATGLYGLGWRMVKDDAKGGPFGETATARVQVDADPPVITVTSPVAQDYAYGTPISIEFGAVDGLSGVATLSATLDGRPVSSGAVVGDLPPGPHVLKVCASDSLGNSATRSVTFGVANSPYRVTGGGMIKVGAKNGSFGFTAECPGTSAVPLGNLLYQDHNRGMTVKSDSLRAMECVDNKVVIFGSCSIDGEPGHRFRVEVTDNGETNTRDLFAITLDDGYSASGRVSGSIAIHTASSSGGGQRNKLK